MNLSLNEVEATARKAARGAGYDWGLAEETGRAARWLCRHDIDGCAILADWLARVDGCDLSTLRPRELARPWQGQGARLCPLTTGATLSDCAGRLTNSPLQLRMVGSPLLLLPFAAAAARRIDRQLRLDGTDMRAVLTSHDDLMLEGDWRQLAGSGDMDITVTLDRGADAAASRTPRARTAEENWQRLNSFASRTYAPASEESRRLGAGSDMADSG